MGDSSASMRAFPLGYNQGKTCVLWLLPKKGRIRFQGQFIDETAYLVLTPNLGP